MAEAQGSQGSFIVETRLIPRGRHWYQNTAQVPGQRYFCIPFTEIRDTVLDRRNFRLPQDSPTALTMEEFAGYPFHCPNCSVTFYGVRLFCSDLCDDEAAFVRYARRRKADGRDEDPNVKEAITIKLAHILGGGYDEAGRRPPESVRQFVKDRDGGRCQICGGPGDDIDHISGSSNAPANLQYLCKACHNMKTVAAFRRITKESHPEKWAKSQGLKKRAAAAEPLLLCDSESWRSIWKVLMRRRGDVATGQGGLFE